MKKIFVLMLALMLTLSGMAQISQMVRKTTPSLEPENTHATFYGVQIDGTVEQFASNLLAVKDWEVMQKEDSKIFLKGTDHLNREVIVMAGDVQLNDGIVDMVTMLYKYGDAWDELMSGFNTLYNEYVELLGEPVRVNDPFEGDLSGEEKVSLIISGQAQYQVMFAIDNGVLILSFLPERDKILVCVMFMDVENCGLLPGVK